MPVPPHTMHVFLVLAVVGSAVAAPQFALPRTSFDPNVINFAPPVANFGVPVAQTTRFAPTVTNIGAPRFAAPANTFNPQLTPFAAPTNTFNPQVTGRSNVIYNLDSTDFVAPARGFAPTNQQAQVLERTHYLNDNSEYGNSFKTSDGQLFSESGSLRPTNDKLDQVVAKQGSYSYTSPEGVPVSITYIADEYGFHPVGDVIPKNVTPLTPTFV